MSSSSNKLIIFVILIAVVCSSCVGGGIALWLNRESLFPDTTTPSTSTNQTKGPTGGTTTLNKITFDSSGYTVGKGKIWNRKPLESTGYSNTPSDPEGWPGKATEDADECRKDCVDRSNCTHFGRQKANGKCYLFQSDGDTATDNGYIRGFKNAPGKLYTTSANLGKDLGNTAGKTTQECKNSCDSTTGCLAWASNLTGTKDCQLWGDGTQSDKYQEGAVGL
jgi:hypothetical protein